jgi:hypothetical protein
MPAASLSGCYASQPTDKADKIVVGMQHPPTTCGEKARTPKKSADARFFSFTGRGARFRLVPEFGCSRFTGPWGNEARLF